MQQANKFCRVSQQTAEALKKLTLSVLLLQQLALPLMIQLVEASPEKAIGAAAFACYNIV